MNFKPTLWKTIISILSGIITNFIIAGNVIFKVAVYCICAIDDVNCTCPQPTWINQAFDPVPVIFSLIAFLLVYLIWSIFQKKS